jgi:predicted aldo/keto reductase-like oxidoreductase
MSSFTMRRSLGRTGLQVSPLGIGGGGHIGNEDLLYAFDCGINYFFFSSDMHHFAYQRSARALRELCGHRSSVREQVVLSTVTYINDPEKLLGILVDQLVELDLEYIDVFHWGWITEKNDMLALLKGSHQLRHDSALTRALRTLTHAEERMQEVNEALICKGLVRFVGASFHSLTMARTWMRNLDVLMLRYNTLHRRAEQEVVPHLSGAPEKDPGVVVFNTARLLNYQGAHLPNKESTPSAPTCYRFALSQPWVDVVLTGINNRQEIEEALTILDKGPMDQDELERIYAYGSQFKGNGER